MNLPGETGAKAGKVEFFHARPGRRLDGKCAPNRRRGTHGTDNIGIIESGL